MHEAQEEDRKDHRVKSAEAFEGHLKRNGEGIHFRDIDRSMLLTSHEMLVPLQVAQP